MMAIDELASLCHQLYFHLLKGGLKKQTRDDLGISIANILKQGIQFTDSNNHVTDNVNHTLVKSIKEKGYVYLENLLSDDEIEALKIYFQDKQLEYSIGGKKIHCYFPKIPKGVGSASYSQCMTFVKFDIALKNSLSYMYKSFNLNTTPF
ncbi:TPA: hypothetical protein EYN98_20560 [Candidatus Poribacteria bacterium]|nr:hypothetical protein [Candidatus Poribacteria bacterium]